MSDTLKKFLVFGENDQHEFDIHVNEKGNYEREYSLFYSNNPPWSEHIRGKLALKLTDTGNNLVFDRKLKILDYDVAVYVKILLNFASTFDTNKVTYTITKQRIIIKI